MSETRNTRKLDYNLSFSQFVKQLDDIDWEIREKLFLGKRNVGAKPEYFPYIPMYHDEDLELIKILLTDGNDSFLDVGCGTGRIMALRKYLTGSKVYGIEVQEPVAKLGMAAYGLKILIGDAFELLTKEFLSKIRIIYTYMPIQDVILMRKLETHIEECITHHTTRIEMLPRYLTCLYPKDGRAAVFSLHRLT